MQLIETKTLVSEAAQIEFTSVPQTFTDLVVICSVRTSRNTVVDFVTLRPNGLSEGSTRRLLGPNLLSDLNSGIFAITSDNNNLAGIFGSVQFYLFNYTSNATKSIFSESVSENNAQEAYQQLCASTWSGTVPITSLTFVAGTGPNIMAGSTISLYGITKGSDGITTVS